MKILVVDDSKLMHKMFEVMLRQYPLVNAYDGQDGLKRLADHTDIDLVLLDINMPGLSGLETKALLGEDHPYVIFATAYPEHAIEAFDLGAVDR